MVLATITVVVILILTIVAPVVMSVLSCSYSRNTSCSNNNIDGYDSNRDMCVPTKGRVRHG